MKCATIGLLVLSVAADGILTQAIPAQCAAEWQRANPVRGTDDEVFATTMWDPDGAGPQPALLVAGGAFSVAGWVDAARIAAYDFATQAWMPLAAGLNQPVRAVAVLPNGDLIAAGEFTTAGGAAAARIARWDGTGWSALAAGMNGTVLALAVMPNGDLVAAGEFTTAGGVPANRVARWHGASWSAMGGGMDAAVTCLAIHGGSVVAGGTFTTAGASPANQLARWHGTSWSAFGAGVTQPVGTARVDALHVMANGTLLVGGAFASAGGVAAGNIARFDGTTWSAMGQLDNPNSMPLLWDPVVYSLTSLPNGEVIAGGEIYYADGTLVSKIARWTGSSWTPMGQGLGPGGADFVRSLTTTASGEVVAAASSVGLLSESFLHIGRWDGATWSSLTDGFFGRTATLVTLAGGDVLASGGLGDAYVARWDGALWTRLGAAFNAAAWTLVEMPTGDLVAGGSFTEIGGALVDRIARWDGSTWTPLGGGMNGPVDVLVRLSNGDLVAGGSFTVAGGVPADRLARWNGTSWVAIGGGVSGSAYRSASNSGVADIVELANGDLLVAGNFTMAGGAPAIALARWDGASWSPVGGLVAGVVGGLRPRANGDLIATGSFQWPGVGFVNIARWTGSNWYAMGSGFTMARAVDELANGDLVAVGEFPIAPGQHASVVRWVPGAGWSALGETDRRAFSLARDVDGSFFVGGEFDTVEGLASPCLTRLTTTCPASVAPAGAGCSGSGGPNVLTATALPWIGTAFPASATGMPPLGLAVGVTGFAPASVPLPAILPQGVSGCSLLVATDLLELHVVAGGAVATSLTLPDDLALAGQLLYQQVVPIELDAQGNITALTATNRLELTIGAY